MEFAVESGDITLVDTDAIVVNLFEGATSPDGADSPAAPEGAAGAVDKALDGAISDLITAGETKGKSGEMTLIHTLGRMATKRVLVAGLGKPGEFDSDTVRSVAAQAARYLRGKGVKTVATSAPSTNTEEGTGALDSRSAAQAIAEGTLLGVYRFDRHKTPDEPAPELVSVTLVESEASQLAPLRAGARDGLAIAEAVSLCRDLVNEPANNLTPADMADIALGVARDAGLDMKVLDEAQMEKLGMGALLGVAAGSRVPPRLIVMNYSGDPENPDNNLGLIGKGITFDSGGISLKPAGGMGAMKGDMAGAASVIGAIKAIAALGPKINVTAIAVATENMPGGGAQRPGDVVTSMSGKTIEVDNTDAEGRLVLADAAAYALTLGLTRLVDVATLTGAMEVALGNVTTGAFGNDRDLLDAVLSAAGAAGEKTWEMPTFDEYREQYKSDVADFKNIGGRPAGSITGAMFIGEFVGDAAWVHLDIAGTSTSSKVNGHQTKGATGVPVRTLVALAQGLASA
jgi:leucyl aminopeptidase